MIAIFRAKFRDVVPPCLEMCKISTCFGIISKSHLPNLSVFEAVDEWCDSYSIHCHSKRVSLGGAFLGEKNFSIYE